MKSLKILKHMIFGSLLAFLIYGFFFSKPDSESARAIASREVKMWKAYYEKGRVRLGYQLTQFLRHYYVISWWSSLKIAIPLSKSAYNFSNVREDYRHTTLPWLVIAYARIKEVSQKNFDPETVAQAELDWWVARRTEGQNSVVQVGEKIALLYSHIYGKDSTAFSEAGWWRAQAAYLRDHNESWSNVEDHLEKCYEILLQEEKMGTKVD